MDYQFSTPHRQQQPTGLTGHQGNIENVNRVNAPALGVPPTPIPLYQDQRFDTDTHSTRQEVSSFEHGSNPPNREFQTPMTIFHTPMTNQSSFDAGTHSTRQVVSSFKHGSNSQNCKFQTPMTNKSSAKNLFRK